MKNLAIPFVLASSVLLGACASMTGKEESTGELDKEANAAETTVRSDKTRTNLGALESAIADYYKAENKIPEKLDTLIPKYMAAIPPIDAPPCGGEKEGVQYYPSEILLNGQIDGTQIRGTGRWGYVHNDRQVVVFVDCKKPSDKGLPWFQERGVY